METFQGRLKDYREKNGLLKTQMADRLHISKTYYGKLESGERSPSSNIAEVLEMVTGLPSEYWIYGLNKNEYAKMKESFKSLKKTIEVLKDFNQFKPSDIENLFTGDSIKKGSKEELLIGALKADLMYQAEVLEDIKKGSNK